MGRIARVLSGVVLALVLLPSTDLWAQFGGGGGGFAPNPSENPFEGQRLAAEKVVELAAATPEQPLCHCADESNSPTTAKIREALNSPLTSAGLEFPGTPLRQVVNFLQDEYDIPIQLDATALDDVGIGPDEPVTINVRNVTLQSGLRLILDQLDLTYVIRNEVLMITTHEEAETELRTCVYNVRDLVVAKNGRLHFDSLIDTIISCVATETWAENGGGEAEVRPLPTGLLTISQTQAVHEEIAGLLTAIRNALDAKPADAGAAANFEFPTELATRSYTLLLQKDADLATAGTQVVSMIFELVPGATAKMVDDEKCWIDHFAGRIVVRHTQEVHEGISELLTDLGLVERRRFGGSAIQGAIANEAGFDGGGFGGGGGF